MTKRSSRNKVLISGGLASAAVICVIILMVVQALTGVDLGFFETEEEYRVVAPATGGEWYQLYFTNPQDEPTWTGGLDEVLAADIDQAESFVDVAIYDFDLESVTDALLRAHRRGVEVRVVVDSDNADLDAPQDLIDAGVPVVEDDRSAIMHDKFIIIDGLITWTGSWNLTENGTYRNNNNAIRIILEELAANYTYEFEEMFLDGEFGPTSPADTPYPRLTIGETRIETAYAPEDGVMERVIEEVSNATESVRFMVFSFTDDDLGAAIRERAAAGVLVEGVFESRGAETEYSEFPLMKEAGLNVWEDGNPGIMHHKVIIIDGETVILGSFNLTGNANKSNDENLLIIHDAEIAAQYLEEFTRIVGEAH